MQYPNFGDVRLKGKVNKHAESHSEVFTNTKIKFNENIYKNRR